ncbi:MAG: hydrogenase maturation protein HypF [Acidimicrobiaceae bacterium]|nr:MAG: hydrogenase maturation protein HypF [Acidimicrobiaceae bacterium]
MIAAPAARVDGVERRRLLVTGVVQGVGFRPFVHRLSAELGLAGFVGNDAAGVFIEVEGDVVVLVEFAGRLCRDAPPLARVESVSQAAMPLTGASGFVIVESSVGGGARTLVPPDVATCDECMAEVLDPAHRRFRYPFTNCTNCGPRFTIISDLPYDRPATTMAGFTMCPACMAEYHDPADRRYHAQPNACPECGPRLRFEVGHEIVEGTDAVLAAAHETFAAGGIVAVKGIGGYHLACDAGSDTALRALRERKGRSDKPFALMVPNLAAAHELAEISEESAAALVSTARPIVLLRRRPGAPVSALVAPGNPLLGVLLPYTPLHHLLFASVPGADDATAPWALVLTSGNLSNEPICTDDAEARTRLTDQADAFLTHDRPIYVPCDDSVIRIVDGHVQPIRRSRGYTPLPVALPVDVAPTLAVGGELKNTCCIASGRRAWVSQHIGDMENLETLHAFERTVDGFQRMYAVQPTVIAADGHPGYLTRRWAMDHCGDRRLVEVQHHHAHVASVMAERGLDGTSPVIGIAFDGTGYGIGDDGAPEIWGGEVLVADYAGFVRAGHLRPLPLPGGDGAVRNPCRIAVAYLAALGIGADPSLPAVAACDDVELAVVRRQVERNLGCVPTTSMGRLFDAVASLLGVRHRISYEAQAAIELEVLAEGGAVDPAALPWSFGLDAAGIIDPAPVLQGIVDAVTDGTHLADIALAFHHAVAAAVPAVSRQVATLHGALPVALTGGVFQNALLTRLTRAALEAEGFEVLTHRLVPPNDGGLSLGQAVIAGYGRS